jgi:putative heme iron utilization protein
MHRSSDAFFCKIKRQDTYHSNFFFETRQQVCIVNKYYQTHNLARELAQRSSVYKIRRSPTATEMLRKSSKIAELFKISKVNG